MPSQTATFDVNKGMELNIWVQKARARGSLFENMRVRCEYIAKKVNKFKDTFSNCRGYGCEAILSPGNSLHGPPSHRRRQRRRCSRYIIVDCHS